MRLLQALQDFCTQQGFEKTYWIAYSGGLDSHVLLSLCQSLRQILPLRFHAIHVNHGLNPNAATWSLHCEKICAAYGIPLVTHTLALKSQAGLSLEEIARDERYACFAACLNDGDILLTAHHEDDQAETVLLQLLRGSGPKGLAAMASLKTFARGSHGRPLLAFSRDMLRHYAKENQLKWIEDESNQNVKFTRNFIRNDIVPLLKNRFKAMSTVISRSAMHCAETQHLLEELTDELLTQTKGSRENTLSIKKLCGFNAEKQRLILRRWIEKHGHRIPNVKKMEAIMRDVLTAAEDRMPCVSWGNTEIRRFRGDLYLMPSLQRHDTQQIFTWDVSQPLSIPHIGLLQASKKKGAGLRMNFSTLSVRFRQGGEVIPLAGHHHTLKNLFQEWKVPSWERNRIPLIFVEDICVAVIGYFLHAEYAAKNDEIGHEICLIQR